MRHIPNILTCLRLLLVPVFILVFFAVSPLAALPISWLAGLTDVLDGTLARRNGWITRLGKILDPIADKLMQGALLFSLVVGGLLPWPFAVPFVAKELAQALLGFLMLRRRQFVVVSRWFGKVALTLFHLAVNVTVIVAVLRPVPYGVSVALWALWALTLGFMIYAFVSYLIGYAMLAAKIKKEWREAQVAPQ